MKIRLNNHGVPRTMTGNRRSQQYSLELNCNFCTDSLIYFTPISDEIVLCDSVKI